MTTLTLPPEGLPAPNVKRLIEAHRHAATFHEQMAEALEAQAEIEHLRESQRDPVYVKHGLTPDAAEFRYEEKRLQGALGAAAMALAKMPAIWAALLGVNVAPSEAMPMKAAAE